MYFSQLNKRWGTEGDSCRCTSCSYSCHLHVLSPIHTADETKLSSRVGVGGVYMNSRRLPTDLAMRTHNAAVSVTTADGCVHTDDTTKLLPTSCKFVYTPPTRRDSTVSSRRRRRCVLGFTASVFLAAPIKRGGVICAVECVTVRYRNSTTALMRQNWTDKKKSQWTRWTSHWDYSPCGTLQNYFLQWWSLDRVLSLKLIIPRKARALLYNVFRLFRSRESPGRMILCTIGVGDGGAWGAFAPPPKKKSDKNILPLKVDWAPTTICSVKSSVCGCGVYVKYWPCVYKNVEVWSQKLSWYSSRSYCMIRTQTSVICDSNGLRLSTNCDNWLLIAY